MRKILIIALIINLTATFLFAQSTKFEKLDKVGNTAGKTKIDKVANVSKPSKTAIELNREGEKYFRQKKYKRALKEYNRAIEKYDIASARTYHNLGWINELNGKPKKAIKNYEEAIKRNPKQIHSSERAGYLYFKDKQFEKAIIAGERVLKLDPGNQSVATWLQQAYAERFKLKQKQIANLKNKEMKKKLAKDVEKEREKEKKTIKFMADFMIRSTYELEGDNDYKYKSTPGYGLNFPNMYYFDLRPIDSLQLSVQTGNPYHGALMPEVIHWMEEVDLLFYTGEYFLGMGVLGNHYKSDSIWGEKEKLNDYKIGIIFGSNWKRSSLYLSLFPRFIPYDAGYSENRTLDVEKYDLKYDFNFDQAIKIYAAISLNGYYYFDHSVPTSNFAGNNDFTVGVELNLKQDLVILSFEVTERLYYLDVLNDKPYTFANGQGLFGINKSKWFRGDPISGFETYGHVISIKAHEKINQYIFLYQQVIAEFVSPSQRGHDFCLKLGAGAAY